MYWEVSEFRKGTQRNGPHPNLRDAAPEMTLLR